MNTAVGWEAYLDSVEEEARAVALLVTAGDTPAGVRSFLPPTHLGALPAELANRVRAVLATMAEASAVVRAELEATSGRLTELGRHDVRGPKPPSSLDLQA